MLQANCHRAVPAERPLPLQPQPLLGRGWGSSARANCPFREVGGRELGLARLEACQEGSWRQFRGAPEISAPELRKLFVLGLRGFSRAFDFFGPRAGARRSQLENDRRESGQFLRGGALEIGRRGSRQFLRGLHLVK